jgi:hypothetical protein
MPQVTPSFPRRRRNGDVYAASGRQAPAYSRYTDPEIFPRFGGDEFDPPPYSTDRRSTVAAPRSSGPRRGIMHVAMLAEAASFIAQHLRRKLNAQFSYFMLPR